MSLVDLSASYDLNISCKIYLKTIYNSATVGSLTFRGVMIGEKYRIVAVHSTEK